MNWGLGQASTFSSEVDPIFFTLLCISSAIVAIVFFLLIYFCWKYHQSSQVRRDSPPDRSAKLEWAMILFVFTFGVGIYVWGTNTFYKLVRTPDDAIEISVTAKQWMWIFHDPQKGDQINNLLVPVGRPVRLLMSSIDVIHSFYVPEFRIKQDVLPARYTSVWFQAEKLGRFEILCTQYCGLSHSQMRGTIEVVSQAEYDKSRNPQMAASEIPHGQNLFTLKGCVSCHDGDHAIGPSLKMLYGHNVRLENGNEVLADENYLRDSILEPNLQIVAGYPAIMPSYQGQMTEDDLRALIRFIKSEGSP